MKLKFTQEFIDQMFKQQYSVAMSMLGSDLNDTIVKNLFPGQEIKVNVARKTRSLIDHDRALTCYPRGELF